MCARLHSPFQCMVCSPQAEMTVGRLHVLRIDDWHGTVTACVACHPFAAVKYLDYRRSEAKLYLLPNQVERDAVGNFVYNDAIVQSDANLAEFSIFIGRRWQRPHRGTIDSFKIALTAAWQLLKRTGIDLYQ